MDAKQSRKLSKAVQKSSERMRDRMGNSAERELLRVTREALKASAKSEMHSRILAYIGLGIAALSLLATVLALGFGGG